jgi:hypothetical protein
MFLRKELKKFGVTRNYIKRNEVKIDFSKLKPKIPYEEVLKQI